jgi:hypothetical protein
MIQGKYFLTLDTSSLDFGLRFENTKALIRSLFPVSGSRNLLRISIRVGISLSTAPNIKILNEHMLPFS